MAGLMRVFILQIAPPGEITADVGPQWIVQVFSGQLSLRATAGSKHTPRLPARHFNGCSAAVDMRARHKDTGIICISAQRRHGLMH